MPQFEHCIPVDIRFGYGCRAKAAEAADAFGTRGFLIVDPAVARTGLFASFRQALGERILGVFNDIEPNPSIECVDRAAGQVRQCGAEYIIAVGGGSTLDAAKAAGLVAATNVPARAYHSGQAPVKGPALPLIALPTTAGTGSEVTPVAVLTGKAQGRKAPIGGRPLLPKVALVDPEWTLSLPPSVTAGGGMDALSHAMEAYWSIHAQPLCDAWALEAARLILGAIETAYKDPADRDARERMSLGSLMAGLAFSLPKTAAVHACSFPLTHRFGLPHGTACALTLDSFLLFNAQAMPEKLARLAAHVGLGDVDALARRILELKRKMRLPTTLSEAGIKGDQIEQLVAESFHPNMKNNPREVTPDLLRGIYAAIQ